MEIIRKFFISLGLKSLQSVGLLQENHIAIFLTQEEDYTRLLLRSTWYVAGAPLKILKWSPDFYPSVESPVVPVWVGLPGLPLHFFEKSALFCIESVIGTPLKMDEPMAKMARPTVARVCIEVDVSKPRSRRIRLGDEKDGFWHDVIFENPPQYCDFCKMLGHDISTCYKKNPKILQESNKTSGSEKTVMEKNRTTGIPVKEREKSKDVWKRKEAEPAIDEPKHTDGWTVVEGKKKNKPHRAPPIVTAKEAEVEGIMDRTHSSVIPVPEEGGELRMKESSQGKTGTLASGVVVANFAVECGKNAAAASYSPSPHNATAKAEAPAVPGEKKENKKIATAGQQPNVSPAPASVEMDVLEAQQTNTKKTEESASEKALIMVVPGLREVTGNLQLPPLLYQHFTSSGLPLIPIESPSEYLGLPIEVEGRGIPAISKSSFQPSENLQVAVTLTPFPDIVRIRKKLGVMNEGNSGSACSQGRILSDPSTEALQMAVALTPLTDIARIRKSTGVGNEGNEEPAVDVDTDKAFAAVSEAGDVSNLLQKEKDKNKIAPLDFSIKSQPSEGGVAGLKRGISERSCQMGFDKCSGPSINNFAKGFGNLGYEFFKGPNPEDFTPAGPIGALAQATFSFGSPVDMQNAGLKSSFGLDTNAESMDGLNLPGFSPTAGQSLELDQPAEMGVQLGQSATSPSSFGIEENLYDKQEIFAVRVEENYLHIKDPLFHFLQGKDPVVGNEKEQPGQPAGSSSFGIEKKKNLFDEQESIAVREEENFLHNKEVISPRGIQKERLPKLSFGEALQKHFNAKSPIFKEQDRPEKEDLGPCSINMMDGTPNTEAQF